MKKTVKSSKKKDKIQKVSRFIYWTPRIVSIIFICFVALFSLDIFDMKLDFWGTVLGLLMHNIPTLILIAVLIIAWKYEWVGGVAFILAGILYIAGILITIMKNGFKWYYLSWAIEISGMAFLIGILFFINWNKKRKN